MKRKKVFLIIPEMSMGGAQRSLSKLSLELALDHQVFLIIFNKNYKIGYPHGGALLSLDVVPGTWIIQKFTSFAQRILRLRKLKRKLGCDVAISFLEGADYINILSRLNEKIVLSIRGSKRYDETIEGRFFWLRNKVLIPWLYRRADIIVTVNYGIANELKAYYGLAKSNIVTIGNFYNTDEIKQLSNEPKTASLTRLYRNPVLLTTGRLAPEKGLKPLVRVFYQLKKKHTNLRLVIVGDGPCYSEIIQLCKKLNLVLTSSSDFEALPDVVLLGSQSNVFKYLKGATAYLMNSSSEGFPNGLVEAMICQVPVISSDCPYGPREILAPEFSFLNPLPKPFISKNGVLMPIITSIQDENCWTELLIDLLDEKEKLLELARQASDRASYFDKALVVSQWREILL